MKSNVPTSSLEMEAGEAVPDFWIHCESISERRRVYHWEIKDHKHDHFTQLFYVKSGSGQAQIEGRSLPIGPATLILIPEKINHGFYFSADVEGLVITFVTQRLPLQTRTLEKLRHFITTPHLLVLEKQADDYDLLVSTLDKLGCEMDAGFGARQGLVEAYIGVILSLSAESVKRPANSDNATNRDLQRISRLNALIGKHFREHLPVEFYARELNVSVTHLNRITKAQTGHTMNELISEKIISQAKADLAFTTMTAQEIAYALGFADPAYFTRYFAREAGETPRQFRDRERWKREAWAVAPEAGSSEHHARAI